jgi:drug/metabolite transporter (DMT)-like permease
MVLWLVILIRIVANPFSNVFQKLLTRKSADPLFIILATHGLLSIVCLPIFLRHLHGMPQAYWSNLLIVGALTVWGNALLVAALKRSDLSVLGPINAYKSVVSLIPGLLLLHEVPTRKGVLGIALIVAGSYFIVDKKVTRPGQNLFVKFFNDRGVQYRLAALVVSAIEAVFLKRAAMASSATITFAGWAVTGFAASILAGLVLLRGRVRREIRVAQREGPTFLMLALTTGLMQLCTIISFGGLKVGYALALFQTSTLLTVLLGYKIFRERNLLERLIGSAIMVAGAILIVLSK